MSALLLRLPEAEHEALKRDAHRHDMNVSEYLRWLIQKEREIV